MQSFHVSCAAAAAATLLFGACHDVAQSDRARDVRSEGASPPQAPLRVVVFFDQTRSMQEARVGHASAESLAPVIERLQIAGGEIAVGVIRDHSDAPLVRLFVAPAPEPRRLRPI